MTDERTHRVLGEVRTGVYVGGRWRDAAGGGRFPVTDPATEEVLVEVADAGPDDARAALDAAVEAQPSWAATPPRQRGQILQRAYELLVERSDDLALLMTLEMGKSLAESKAEVTYAAEFLRWFGEQAVRIAGRWSDEPNGSGRLLTMRQPVGPCLLITPWNFPMAMGTRKVGPAVAAGCTMVFKPAQITPLSTLALTSVLEEAGLPPGVLNVVPSTSAGRTIGPVIGDPRLRKMSFTGSTEVGRSLMAQASEHVLRVSMELGGNAPLLVFDDADLDKAVAGAVVAKTRNVGQSCVAANRIYVQDGVAREFTDRFVERMRALKVGRGTEEGVDLGPLASKEQRDKVVELVTDAVDRGATLLCGGEQPEGPGFAYPPTVLGDVPDDARILREEVFGPVAPIRTFSAEDDAVRQANDTEFGLVAYVFTEGLARTLRVVEALEVGMVGVNRGLVSNPAAPFGGVKQSGFGREGGLEGIEEYLSVKYTAIDT